MLMIDDGHCEGLCMREWVIA